jgi:heat shock protein HtpX
MNNLTSTTLDWRATLRANNYKTFFVITLFFIIYIALGLLVDTYISANHYPDVPPEEIFSALVTFHLFPLATVVMTCIAAISLLVTFSMHDKLMLLGTEYHEVTPTTARNTEELQFYNCIEELKIAAGLSYMPKVFIIEANYMNAFASGYSEKSAMVAITRGLLTKLNRAEIQADMAHQLSHIRHMDIKLTLMASVLANLVIMVLDIFFYNAFYSRRDDNRSRNNLAGIIILLRYLLPIINVLLLLYLSRTREYMADAGAVELLRDNQPLASALLKINNDYKNNQDAYSQQQSPHENVRREAYIYDPAQAGIFSMSSFADLFSTHPNLKSRLAALGFKYDES